MVNLDKMQELAGKIICTAIDGLVMVAALLSVLAVMWVAAP